MLREDYDQAVDKYYGASSLDSDVWWRWDLRVAYKLSVLPLRPEAPEYPDLYSGRTIDDSSVSI